MKFGNSIFKTFFLSLCIIANTSFAYAQTASILPPAKTTFVDQNGKPLTSGTVDFYIPGTTTRKTTWQDSTETTPNTNPVVLDGAGRALIWGDGAYRQIVKDRNGNLIWDQVTSSIGSGSSGTTTVGDGDAVGTIKPFSGLVPPSQYQLAYGQALSRTTYPELLSAINIFTTVTCVGGSPILTSIADTTNVNVGAKVESICAPSGASVISKTSSTVTLSANSTISVTASATIFPFGNGDGLTTFNIPDLRGYVLAGRCNMGGVNCSNVTSSYFSTNANNTPSAQGAVGGSQSHTQTIAELPTISSAGSNNITVTSANNIAVNNGSVNAGNAVSGAGITVPAASGGGIWTSILSISGTNAISVASTGTTNNPYSVMQPTMMLNYIIKVTPDSASSSFTGVTSVGGMSGVLTCGSGILCAGQSISAIPVVTGVASLGGMTGVLGCGTGVNCSGNVVSTTVNSISVADRTALKALDTTVYKTAILTQAGRNGIFNFLAGDYTTAIATDTNEGVYIKATAIASNVGAWVRQFNFIDYQILWFGATADYTTDNTSIVNSAIAVANVQNTISTAGKQAASFINISGGVKFASQNLSWLPSVNWVFVYLHYFANSDTSIGVATGGGATNEFHTLSVNSGYPSDATGGLVSEDMWGSPLHPSRGVNIQKNIDNSIYVHSGTTQSVQPNASSNAATGTMAYVRDENLDRFRLSYTNYGTQTNVNGTSAYVTNRTTSLTCTGCNGAGAWGANIPAVGAVVRGMTTLSRYVVTSLATLNILQTDWLSGTAIPGEFLMNERAIIKASISGTTMTVSSFFQGSGNLAVGQTCVGMYANNGITAGTNITVSAGGGTGSYTVNNSQTVAATEIVCGYVSANSIQGGGVTNTDTTYRPLQFTSYGDVVVPSKTFANTITCSALNKGGVASISDSNINTWGSTIAGGGANQVLGYCNGSNWTVMAK